MISRGKISKIHADREGQPTVDHRQPTKGLLRVRFNSCDACAQQNRQHQGVMGN
jgi:hypothetical protein